MEKIKKYMLPDITDAMYQNEAISSISLAKSIGQKINEIISYLNELENIRDAKYLDQDGKIQKAIIYLKDNLENTCREILKIMKNNGELGTIIEDSITKLNEEISRLYENRIIHIDEFTPDVFFATDNTSVISQAFALRKNEPSKIMFAPKNYTAKGTIYLYSNTEIDLNGATITDSETDYNDTTRDSGGLRFLNNLESMKLLGYGALKNITIKNGTFDGGTCGVLFSFFHGENILIENVTFKNCCMGTHIFDLAGCSNVKFKNCIFEGCSLPPNINYREMIQPDYARYTSTPYWGNNDSYGYDNLPTIDLTVEGCTFSKGDGTTYPNAIGTHGAIETKHKNIRIINNKFYDTTVASIRLPWVEDVTIRDNRFYNANSDTRVPVPCILFENTYLQDGDTLKNITIQNNALISNNTTCSLIFAYIRGKNGNITNNIIVSGNRAIAKNAYNDNTADFLQLGNVENITITNNIVSNLKNFIHCIGSVNDAISIENMSILANKCKDCRTFLNKHSKATLINEFYQGNTWTVAGVQTLKANNVITQLYAGDSYVDGKTTIEFEENINNYDYLIVSTGTIADKTFISNICLPFNMNLGFRPDDDYLNVNTVGGVIVIHIENEHKISFSEINSSAKSIRKIYGVKAI